MSSYYHLLLAIALAALFLVWAYVFSTPRRIVAAWQRKYGRLRFPVPLASIVVHLAAIYLIVLFFAAFPRSISRGLGSLAFVLLLLAGGIGVFQRQRRAMPIAYLFFAWPLLQHLVRISNMIPRGPRHLGFPLSRPDWRGMPLGSVAESVASYFRHWGIPVGLTISLVYVLVLAILTAAHIALVRHGWFDNQNSSSLRAQRRLAIGLKYLGIAVIVAVVLFVGVALIKDPPTGGRNPGGPSPGALFGMALLFGLPFVPAGFILFIAAQYMLRRNATRQGNGRDAHGRLQPEDQAGGNGPDE